MTDDLKERLRPPGRSVVSKCADVDGKDLSNAPLTYERIWLQAGDAEVTWCQHSQDDEDVPYVREDFYSATIARITDLEAKLQRLGRELNLAKYGEPDFAWEIHQNAVAELEARLAAAEAECWELHAQIVDLKACIAEMEAGEDALAEALRSYRADLCEGFCLEAEWSDEAHNHPAMQRDCGGCLAAAALAAYEARRKKG